MNRVEEEKIYNIIKEQCSFYGNKYKVKYHNIEDIIQDVSYKVFKNIHKYNKEVSSLRVWISVITNNTFKVMFRDNDFTVKGTTYKQRYAYDIAVEDNSYKENEIKSTYAAPAIWYDNDFEVDYIDNRLTEEDLEKALITFKPFEKTTELREQQLNIFKMFLDGEPGVEIADRYNINYNTYKSIIYTYKGYFIKHLKKQFPSKQYKGLSH